MPQCDHFDDPTICKFCAPRDVVVARLESEIRRLGALTIRDADGRIVTQGAFNALMGQRDRAWEDLDTMTACYNAAKGQREAAREPARAIARALNSLDHAEDCQKHAHDECGPDDTEPDGWRCDGGGLDRDECEPRECECGLSQQVELADELLAALGLLPTKA